MQRLLPVRPFSQITRRKHRDKDNPESFKVRLKAYADQTAPLIPYYEGQGKLAEVDGMGSVEAVAQAIAQAIDNR